VGNPEERDTIKRHYKELAVDWKIIFKENLDK
jgi:hypothetical protein